MKYLVLVRDNIIIYSNKKILRSSKVVRNIILRPFLFDFLDTLKNYYILNIFTAGTKQYCDMVSKKIENKHLYFDKKLCGEDLDENGKKNLKKISEAPHEIILIDDNINYIDNEKNSIQIKPFFGETNDDTLLRLKKILIKIHGFNDTQKGILEYKKRIIKINRYKPKQIKKNYKYNLK